MRPLRLPVFFLLRGYVQLATEWVLLRVAPRRIRQRILEQRVIADEQTLSAFDSNPDPAAEIWVRAVKEELEHSRAELAKLKKADA